MKHQARALTLAAKGGRLRELKTPCRVSPSYDPATQPAPPSVEFKALWDTGATNSAITQTVVDKCGLKPIGLKTVHTAAGTHERQKFLVSIVLMSNVEFHGWEVACVDAPGEELIIGMDIITLGDFSVTSQGNTVFSYRLPSMHVIDYVKDTNAAREKVKKKHAKQDRRKGKGKRR